MHSSTVQPLLSIFLDVIDCVFNQMNVLMESSGLSGELRKYLPLYSEVILESPVIRDGSKYYHTIIRNVRFIQKFSEPLTLQDSLVYCCILST